MQNDDGGEFIILDRWFNLSGIPDFKNPNSTSVTVSMFDVNKKSNYVDKIIFNGDYRCIL